MDDKMTDAKHQPSKPAAVAGSSGPRRLTTSRIVAWLRQRACWSADCRADHRQPLHLGGRHARHLECAERFGGATDTTGHAGHTITVSGSATSAWPRTWRTCARRLGHQIDREGRPRRRRGRHDRRPSRSQEGRRGRQGHLDRQPQPQPELRLQLRQVVPALTGYTYSNTIKVTVRDLTTVAAVVDDSTAAGATTCRASRSAR